MNTSVETSKEIQDNRARSSRLMQALRPHGLQLGIMAVGIIIWLLFVISSPRTWIAPDIYVALMTTVPFFALVAIPLTLVVIAGEIDLSFPSIMAFGMLIFTRVVDATHNVLFALGACLLAGLLAGFLNGWIVVRIGVPSLVVTIGTQFFWRGVVLV